MDRKRISRISLETFLSDSLKKLPSVTLLIEKCSGLKKLHRMVYHVFVKNWFSQQYQKFRRRNLHFSENFFYRKFLWLGGAYHDFLSKLFCLTVPEELLGGPFFQKISRIKKLHKMVYHDFVENWFSHSTVKIHRGLLQFSEKFFYRKGLWIGRGYHEFLSNFFCLAVPKKLVGEPFVFQKFFL